MYKAGNQITAKQIGKIFSKKEHIGYKRHLGRWLDATKSNIFFGRKVLLVEGIAERLLIPELAEKYWNRERKENEPLRTFDGYGISIISVDGVAFRPFLHLFSEEGLNIKCAVLTDSDPDKIEVMDGSTGETIKVDVFPTKSNLAPLCSRTTNLVADYLERSNVLIRTNIKTFEYDLILENNSDFYRKLISKYELGSKDARERVLALTGDDFVKEAFLIIAATKGEAAQFVLDEVQNGETLNIPKYITDVFDFMVEK
jgi:putative ATP-dependent endonuclease of OLD family